MTKKITFFFLIVFFPFTFFAQQTIDSFLSKKNIPIPLSISGYVDAYYAYYTDSTGDEYQKFPSVSPRSNQIGLNSALLSISYDADRVRGIATFHFGDIPKSTWSPKYNYLMEAHVGVRIVKKLWFDAGFFRTHFGTEGLLPKENLTSSVAVATYYEPYYEAGFRLNYNPGSRWSINLFLLNGNGIFEDNNKKKSFGALVTYALGDHGNLGYSNYIGDDSPRGDSVSHTRFMQNVFFNYQAKKLKIQVGLDYCMQKHADIGNPKKGASMISGFTTLKYEIVRNFSIYGREEFFYDPEGFMSGVITDSKGRQTGYKLWGSTLGLEFKPTENSYIRLEGRSLGMENSQKIFHWAGEDSNTRLEAMFHLGISF